MNINTCVCCQKNFTEGAEAEQSLSICPMCVAWKNNHRDEIVEHKNKMLQNFSPAVKANFDRMPKIERLYVVLRSMEIKHQSSKLKFS
ncbi:hypothetical protein [Vibrio sp. 1180_3]|uniref:hypothetical protein n=1 Tax=Vibrio sp. 1180_3 TaxID=2528832 RepID=UPI0024057F08|nr:hypothetical protein [Vibrio sp. 1180_3]MDF9399059.1 hypothetical protein [Vibrio sp. 1180_3]